MEYHRVVVPVGRVCARFNSNQCIDCALALDRNIPEPTGGAKLTTTN